MSYEPAEHYDRVTEAWGLLLGDELHYGVFATADTPLPEATGALTAAMTDAARLEHDQTVLDVGCGTGAPACTLAASSGVRVTGITTSETGVRAAQARARTEGLEERTVFTVRDGMDNGFDAETFDRVWALESSHLMRARGRLVAECARVLKTGGRFTLCDITLQRAMDLQEVRRLRKPLALLRDVFGDARMEPLGEYRRLMTENGLNVDIELDLTDATRPTFASWRSNADRYRTEVIEAIGQVSWEQFRESCDVLEGFWDDGTLGYGLIAAEKS